VEVQDKLGRKVRARILVDAAGRNVRDPMTGGPLLVDQDFDINHAIAFGRALAPMMNDPDASAAALAAMYHAFHQGGSLDMQRSYNGMVGGEKDEFVSSFRPAASYILGVVGRAAGLNPEDIIGGAGRYNRYQKVRPSDPNPDIDTSGPSGNAPTNARWIEEGIRAYDSGRFSKSVPGGQPAPQRQENPPMPNFAATAPQPADPQSTAAGQSRPYQPVAVAAAPGLPQHVIEAGNLLRANGYEITPRTMYLAHVLGPQAAVDLINRTGSTASPAVPPADAATGDQMRAWVRALRLGPAAARPGIAGAMAPAPDAGPATPDQSSAGAFDGTQPFA
jgi:hypothetical protein